MSAGDGTGSPWLSAVRVLHPFPSLLVTAVTAALVPLADGDTSAALYGQLGLGMLCFQFAIGVANDVVDADEDADVKPWKAIPRGIVSRRLATILCAALAGAGLAITLPLPGGAWLVGLAGLACGLAYDAGLKRTAFSWLPYAIAFPLVPVWVFLAADAWDPWLWWTLPLGALLGFALHLANQAPDREASIATGTGVLERTSARIARQLSIAMFGAVASVATLLLLGREPGLAAVAAGTGIVVAILSHVAPRLLGRDGLFGLMAASAAVLAVTFLAAT